MMNQKQSKTTTSRMKVVMLPWLAHGHINAFLELAKKLTKRNFQIYLCSTPINLTSIKKRITQEYSDSIKLVEFHLKSSPQLPPHHHTTNGLPPHLIQTLRIAQDEAGPQFISNILKTLSPDLLIYDFNQGWAGTVASSYNVPAILFLSGGTVPLCSGLHSSLRPRMEFPFPGMQLQEYHAKKSREKVQAAKGIGERFNQALAKSGGILLFNTFRGLEGKYIDYLSVLMEKKIVPVGPIIQEAATDDEEEDSEIMRWLAKKEDSSTVFVSFGSESYLSKPEMEEMAHGLELSEVNFIWVVRPPQDGGDENGVSTTTTIEEALPEGFLERVRSGGRGLVVDGWAPQAKILAHPSSGGFVSHCGWNSTMESLKSGVPIIAVPMHFDQPFNARLLEEIGAGLEVKRDDDGRLDRNDIAQVIRKVVLDKSGEEIRIKARELSEAIRLEGVEQIDVLVQELTKLNKATTTA